jgi:hypothetical protein
VRTGSRRLKCLALAWTGGELIGIGANPMPPRLAPER